MSRSFQHFGCALVTCLSIFSVVYSQNNQTAPQSPLEQLSQHFYYKCWYATQSMEAYDKLKNASSDLYNYFSSTIELLPHYRKQYCESERQELEKRIHIFSKHLKVCLPEKEKFLGGFLRDSFKELLHFLCHNAGENVNRFFSTRAKSCRTTLLNNNDGASLSNCMSRIFAPAKGIDSLTQTEVCDDLTILKKCFNAVLIEKCPSYEPYQVLNENFFRYISQPCGLATPSPNPGSSTNYLSNSFLLSISLIVSYLISQ